MLTRTLFRIAHNSSKIKINDILNRSYPELVDLVAQKYGNKEFNHPNTAALYQIQHQFKVVAPGDWVLDIGAGPSYRWSELALGLAENQEQTHRVVSNDKLDCRSLRPHQQFVRGDFCEEQIRTKIGLTLQSNKFNTILVDVSPEYTGNIDEDGQALASIIQHALYFSNLFLQKGGNFVCKVLHCSSTSLLQETGKLFFNEAHVFKPSVIRTKSPVQFLVFKGFAMSHNLEALRDFLNRYRGSPKNKIEVVKSYENKYNWDPIKVIRNKMKNDIIQQKMGGRSSKEIQKMYENDPYLNIGQVMKQLKRIQMAEASNDDQQLKKAIHVYSEGKLFSEFAEVPTNRQEWITFIEEMQAQSKQAKKPEKKKQNLEPLKDNQVYMKNEQLKTPENQPFIYLQQDLTGQYQIKFEEAFIQRQISKLNHVLKAKDGKQFTSEHFMGKQKFSLQDDEGKEFDYSQLSKPLSQMAEEMRLLSDQQFKEQLEKEGYDEESESFITKSVKSNRNKFRNH